MSRTTRSGKATPALSRDSSQVATESSTGTAATTPVTPSASSTYLLETSPNGPPRVFVLPADATTNSQIVTLPNPRTARPARYLICPDAPRRGFFEVTKVTAPKSSPRSWLVAPATPPADGGLAAASFAPGADLFVATPFDPLFLVLPALVASKAAQQRKGGRVLFVSSDDHFDNLPCVRDRPGDEGGGGDVHLNHVLQFDGLRTQIEARMAAVCETVDAGDEKMFRLDEDKLAEVLLEKARALGASGLPASMDEKFVKRALEAPLLAQKRTETQMTTTTTTTISTPVSISAKESAASGTEALQTVLVSRASTAAAAVEEPVPSDDGSTEDALKSAMTASPEIVSLQRTRIAFDFICARYVPPELAARLLASLAEAVDLDPLTQYLADLSIVRAEALEMRSVSMAGFSRKHDRDGEEDTRAEKKRKADEEKKRKKSLESRGVRNLKKVDTSGMMKLSAFFQKKKA